MTDPITDPEPFALLDDLKARLDWTLSTAEESMGTEALADLSDAARFYGRDWPEPTKAPRMVRTIVLQAAVSYMRNPDAYTQSRAGDETLGWTDLGDGNNFAKFNSEQIATIRELAGKTAMFGSAPVTAWETNRWRWRYHRGYRHECVPTLTPDGEKPFPLCDPEWDCP